MTAINREAEEDKSFCIVEPENVIVSLRESNCACLLSCVVCCKLTQLNAKSAENKKNELALFANFVLIFNNCYIL